MFVGRFWVCLSAEEVRGCGLGFRLTYGGFSDNHQA